MLLWDPFLERIIQLIFTNLKFQEIEDINTKATRYVLRIYISYLRVLRDILNDEGKPRITQLLQQGTGAFKSMNRGPEKKQSAQVVSKKKNYDMVDEVAVYK